MRGKSRLNDSVREQFKAMGLEPCPLCRVDGKWDIFHTAGNPCPKQKPSMAILAVDEAAALDPVEVIDVGER